jgi:hypothetical protein
MEPIATVEEKRQLLQWLRNSDKKYRRPFDSGEMAVMNILGGSWNEYAQVVFNMLIADTLVNIEEQLSRIADSVGEPGTPAGSGGGLGNPLETLDRLLADGRISPDEYRERREEVLREI